jgi:hypothetical protein
MLGVKLIFFEGGRDGMPGHHEFRDGLLVFDLVFMVFPFSVASADHGTGAHGNKVCGGRQRKSPRTYERGLQVSLPVGLGGRGEGGPAGLCF